MAKTKANKQEAVVEPAPTKVAEEEREFPMAAFPSWQWFDNLFRDPHGRHMIKVDEFTENGSLVVRAEIPGVDPDKDVDISVDDGMLHITAERREEEESTERGFRHQEIRYGSFARSIAVPDSVDESDVAAAYKDGVLEVRVTLPKKPHKKRRHRVKIART